MRKNPSLYSEFLIIIKYIFENRKWPKLIVLIKSNLFKKQTKKERKMFMLQQSFLKKKNINIHFVFNFTMKNSQKLKLF